MSNLNEGEFIKKLCPEGQNPKSMGIMSLDEINTKLKGIIPKLEKRGTHPKEFSILGVTSIQNIEGICKIAIADVIPPGKKDLSRRRNYVLWGNVLPSVVTPIILKSGKDIYHVFAEQDRLTLGGKVTIEVYRGFVPKGTKENKLGLKLIEIKLPEINKIADLLEVRSLGTYWNNTGLSGVTTPIKALFYVLKEEMNKSEIKKALKFVHKYETDPNLGPTIPATEPVLRTLKEVEDRLNEIENLGENTNEAYLNDVFSVSSLLFLSRTIEKNGLPY